MHLIAKGNEAAKFVSHSYFREVFFSNILIAHFFQVFSSSFFPSIFKPFSIRFISIVSYLNQYFGVCGKVLFPKTKQKNNQITKPLLELWPTCNSPIYYEIITISQSNLSAKTSRKLSNFIENLPINQTIIKFCLN